MHITHRHTIISPLAIAASLAGVGAAIAADTATPTTGHRDPRRRAQAGDTAPGIDGGCRRRMRRSVM